LLPALRYHRQPRSPPTSSPRTPPEWDSTPIAFQLSTDGINFLDLYHVVQTTQGPWTSYEVAVMSVPAGSSLLLPVDAGLNVGWLKIRSGARAQPVNQAADRAFTVVCS
jgi:hypothetical protein